jgi:hypothetical protein
MSTHRLLTDNENQRFDQTFFYVFQIIFAIFKPPVPRVKIIAVNL